MVSLAIWIVSAAIVGIAAFFAIALILGALGALASAVTPKHRPLPTQRIEVGTIVHRRHDAQIIAGVIVFSIVTVILCMK
jgi:hypothetical protein